MLRITEIYKSIIHVLFCLKRCRNLESGCWELRVNQSNSYLAGLNDEAFLEVELEYDMKEGCIGCFQDLRIDFVFHHIMVKNWFTTLSLNNGKVQVSDSNFSTHFYRKSNLVFKSRINTHFKRKPTKLAELFILDFKKSLVLFGFVRARIEF